jgi:hypothetical protein
MAGDNSVNIDIEVVSPQRKAELRRLGVELPTGSGALGDPGNHSDFIDNRLSAVGFGIYVGGYHLYVTGVALPVLLPNALVDLSLCPASAIGPEIYDSLDAAKEAVRKASPLAAGSPVDTVRFAYWRGYGGLILPSVFSNVTAPRTMATARLAMSDLAQQVEREMSAMALSLLGARILSAAYSRLVRAVNSWGEQPVILPGSNATKSASALGKRIGGRIKSLQRGKRVAIAEQVSAEKLPQFQAAEAVNAASQEAFGATGGTARLPNGDVLVSPAKIGDGSPVFLVRPNGRVLPGSADIQLTVPMSKTNPFTFTNVKTE